MPSFVALPQRAEGHPGEASGGEAPTQPVWSRETKGRARDRRRGKRRGLGTRPARGQTPRTRAMVAMRRQGQRGTEETTGGVTLIWCLLS